MAFDYNENIPKKITYNEKNVKRIVHKDGTVLWTAATPFYWFQRLQGENEQYYEYADGYPTEWTKTGICCEDNASWNLKLHEPSVSCDNWDAHLGAKAEASAKGNKYVTVYVVDHAWGNSKLTLNGQEFTSAGTHTVDVSATDKLTMELYTEDGMVINYIYFHD